MSRSFAFALRTPTRRIIVRPASWDDIEGMARVSVDTWRLTYKDILPKAYLERMRLVRQETQRSRMMHAPGVHHFVAIEPSAGEVVAFVSCGPTRNGGSASGEIYELYVQNGYQGRGLGRRLFRAAMDRLARDGHERLVVWVLNENPNFNFYPRMGGWLHAKKTIRVGGRGVDETAYLWPLDRANRA
ncbi:MAG TPA: GNAT family N-acetyltransferase [Caulobacteraceae bacterium]|jgi:ribosomal protein S18 acetylase RimI-like enzyme